MKRLMKRQFIQHNHSTQSFIDEAPDETTDETTIHSTQSFAGECLINANEPKIKRMIKGNKLFYYHH